MSRRRFEAQEVVVYLALRLLKEGLEMSQGKLAAEVGVSIVRDRSMLSSLIDKGVVKLVSFTATADIRRYAFILASTCINEKAL